MLIEGNPFDGLLIQEHLQSELDCTFGVVTSHFTLLEELDRERPDVVVSDSDVPRFHDLAALDYLQAMHPTIPFIFCAGHNSPELRDSALSRGAKAWVTKQDLPQLVKEIRRVCGLAE